MTKEKYYLVFTVLMLALPRFSLEQIPFNVHLEDQNFTSGPYEFQAYDSITMTNVTVDGGVDVTLRSFNIIGLYPGVNISLGANFQAFTDSPLISQLIDDAELYIKVGDYDDAIVLLKRVLEIDPGHVIAHYQLGLLYYQKEEVNTAIGYLEKVLELATPGDPLVPESHYRLGLWKFPGDPYNFHFDKVLELVSPNDPLALLVKDARINYHLNRGSALFDAGDCNGAIMEYLQALQIDPDHARAHYQLAISYICLDDNESCVLAKYHLMRFIELAPDDPEVPTAKDLLLYLNC